MIKYVTGNIFESNAKCLVNTVNCEGYMGKGIAYQFKQRFPENNRDYVKACKSGKLHIGIIHYYYEDGVLIVNFPTKDKWRENSQMYFIEVGLDGLVELIINEKIESIAIPPLGCGNGGLEWNSVKQLIVSKLAPVENLCEIMIYEPTVSYKALPKEAPQVNVSALVLLLIRLNLEKFGALRLQKTGYFVNYYLGEDYFKFDKWKYGPYSHAIDIVAKNIKEYQQYYNLDNSKDTYEHIYKDICCRKVDEKIEKMKPAIDKATMYVNAIGTDKKLEGVATILFIIRQNNNCLQLGEVVDQFKNWSEDKAKRFSEDNILECVQYLEDTGIILKNILGLYQSV
jgi:O-acetyl-ADP-ribose deacetylase (regulator of RNase III)